MKESGLKPNQPNHNKKVSSALERWFLCSGNSGNKQKVSLDISFAVELKVFLKKILGFLLEKQTNKSLTAWSHHSSAQSASFAVHHYSSVLLGPNLTLTPLPPRRTTTTIATTGQTDTKDII
jgi:hypothetical protein